MSGGNLGAPPKPPASGSNSSARVAHRGVEVARRPVGAVGGAARCLVQASWRGLRGLPAAYALVTAARATRRRARRGAGGRTAWPGCGACPGRRSLRSTARRRQWSSTTVIGQPPRPGADRRSPACRPRRGRGAPRGSTLMLDESARRTQTPRADLVVEGLVRHDVAPVAGGVADRAAEQARRDAAPPSKASGRPLPPVDGVVGVLEEVRRGGAQRGGWAPRQPRQAVDT